MVPIVAEHLVEDFFVGKTSAVMTNVPGPKEPLYMAGSRLNSLMFWVPVYGNTGMGISIMSYAGTVMVGIMTDTCMVPDPMTIAENFNVELRDMERWLLPAATQAVEEEKPAEEEEWDLAPEMITEEAVSVTRRPAEAEAEIPGPLLRAVGEGEEGDRPVARTAACSLYRVPQARGRFGTRRREGERRTRSAKLEARRAKGAKGGAGEFRNWSSVSGVSGAQAYPLIED